MNVEDSVLDCRIWSTESAAHMAEYFLNPIEASIQVDRMQIALFFTIHIQFYKIIICITCIISSFGNIRHINKILIKILQHTNHLDLKY